MKPLHLGLLLLGFLAGALGRAQTVLQNTTYTSNVTVSGPSTIDANTSVTVASSADVTFQASTSIRLGPGFTAVSGSTFHAVLGSSSPVPVITSSATAGGTINLPFSYTITATNSPTTFGATGLPANLSVNSSTGAITGTPAVAGNFSITLSATNANGTGFLTLTLTIGNAGADSDGDGIPDSWETSYGLNPANSADALLDGDNDGLSNLREYLLGTNPTVSDRTPAPQTQLRIRLPDGSYRDVDLSTLN